MHDGYFLEFWVAMGHNIMMALIVQGLNFKNTISVIQWFWKTFDQSRNLLLVHLQYRIGDEKSDENRIRMNTMLLWIFLSYGLYELCIHKLVTENVTSRFHELDYR
jgi:hypothetical protein